MDRLTIRLGKASIEDASYFEDCVGKIVATREWTKQQLATLGFTFPDSKTNFIFATHKTMAASEIFEQLKQRDIYVRYFAKPRIDNYLRITVGTREQMQQLMDALGDILSQ